MAVTLQAGETFVTSRSHEQVRALEVIPNKNGSVRVFVENGSGERRWTTVKQLKSGGTNTPPAKTERQQ